MRSPFRPAVLLCLGLMCGGHALAAANQAADLEAALQQAVSPAQLSTLTAFAAGRDDANQEDISSALQHLRQALNVDNGVALALLRILDGANVPVEHSYDDVAQSAAMFHAVIRDLAEAKGGDAEAQSLIEQARAAMGAGLFSDAEALIEQLEAHAAAADDEPHRLAAARARTLLGKLALMNLEYEKATEAFELARQRIGAVSTAQRQPANPLPLPQLDADWSLQVAPVMPAPTVEPLITLVVRPATAMPVGQPMPSAPSGAAAVAISAAKPMPALRALPADMVKRLLHRGDAMFALGDLTSARLLYERAADAGEARGATGAGMTYDPWVLAHIGARGIRPDPDAAAGWYRKAVALGDLAATARLKRLAGAGNQ